MRASTLLREVHAAEEELGREEIGEAEVANSYLPRTLPVAAILVPTPTQVRAAEVVEILNATWPHIL